MSVFVLYGAKGGVGATTLACELAARLTAVDGGAVLVDLDLQNGDVLGALDLTATTTLADVLADLDGLEGDALRRHLPRHAAGFFVLSQANRLEQLEQIGWPAVADLLARLQRHFGAVIIDGVRDFSDVGLAALDAATVIAIVTTPELLAVRGARRGRVVLRQLGFGDDKLALVVNRARRRAPVSPAALAEAVELAPLATVRDGAATTRRMRRELDALATRLAAQAARTIAEPEPPPPLPADEPTRITPLPRPSRWRWRRRIEEA